jgi:hypothetical protein
LLVLLHQLDESAKGLGALVFEPNRGARDLIAAVLEGLEMQDLIPEHRDFVWLRLQ